MLAFLGDVQRVEIGNATKPILYSNNPVESLPVKHKHRLDSLSILLWLVDSVGPRPHGIELTYTASKAALWLGGILLYSPIGPLIFHPLRSPAGAGPQWRARD